MKLSELKKSSPEELLELAQSLGAENISRAKKQTLIFIILLDFPYFCKKHGHGYRIRS